MSAGRDSAGSLTAPDWIRFAPISRGFFAPLSQLVTESVTRLRGRLLRRLWPQHARHMHACPIEPLDQRRQLCRGEPHHPIRDRRPFERALLEALAHQQQSSAIPEQKLDAVGTLGTEHQDSAGERVLCQRLLGERRKPVHAFAEIHRSARHEDPHATRRDDHRALFTAASTSTSAFATTRPRTRTVIPATSISIALLAMAPHDAGAVAPSVIIGTNAGGSPLLTANCPFRA